MGTVDFQQLEEKFFLTLYEPEKTVLTMPASDLLNAENMMRLIDTYSPLIKAKERSTAAVFFISWYAGVCCAMHHMLFRSDAVILDLSLSNLSVQLYAGDQYPLFSFKINETRFRKMPITDRNTWRKKSLDSFYREHVTPLIEVLSQLAQMSAIPLWGQIVNALYAQMEEEWGEASEEESRKTNVFHFQMLMNGIDSSAFGLRKNPFDITLRFIEHPNIPERKIVLKTACCLAYRLDTEFGYCYECPRLKEKDRALMRANAI
ncbi:hypothetical protein Back11_54250 [Paenibacillus baekrokdamisoli]|uniref:Uncharacterized protein n=1 Tax=Paenibacillus baekrokdamisoli TaxID=1712516 RepID=A0A3G9IYU9_9BACL|nr:hypothetical protein [Paenibacillus baekrokdamisoli]MBB3071937.1 ferric iron reductase protein FhuF [Paenibacillus baekrokdamisoli]BBH24080.1 hypothetical protein Back11_54250 [Paenibacillus baekrokdamisoli]